MHKNDHAILVVDDSKVSVEAVSSFLRESGFTNLLTAGSASEAHEILAREREGNGPHISLILLDIYLSDANGIETCRAIKADSYFADTPVIMITSSTASRDLALAFEAGAMDYLSKPVTQADLTARVNSALRLKSEIDRRKKREAKLVETTRKLAKAHRKLKEMSLRDGLTKVANRRFLDKTLDQEWRRAARNGDWLSVIMIDIDNFKAYNDMYGHLTGDDCLIKVARTIRDCLKRPGDFVARYGGEEFSVILPGNEPDKAFIIAEIIRKSVENLGIEHKGGTSKDVVSVSLGVASAIPDRQGDANSLTHKADQALYQAKKAGRNRCRAWNNDGVKQ